MLQKDPEQRFTSCLDAAEALGHYLKQQPEQMGERQVAEYVQRVGADKLEQATREMSQSEISPQLLTPDVAVSTRPGSSAALDSATVNDRTPQAKPVEGSTRRGRAWLWFVLGAALSAAVAVGITQLNQPGTTPDRAVPIITQRVIAVFPFEILNKDPRAGTYGRGASTHITTVLSAVPQLKVIAPANLQRAGESLEVDLTETIDEAAAINVARRAGAEAKIVGTVQLVGYIASLNARVIDVATGELLFAEEARGEFMDMFGLYDALAQRLAKAFPPADRRVSPLSQPATAPGDR